MIYRSNSEIWVISCSVVTVDVIKDHDQGYYKSIVNVGINSHGESVFVKDVASNCYPFVYLGNNCVGLSSINNSGSFCPAAFDLKITNLLFGVTCQENIQSGLQLER